MYSVPTVKDIKANIDRNGPLFEVVSLFAGGGGSSCGYRMAGGRVLAINEFVPEARATYRANWPDTHIFEQDVRQLTGKEILKVIGKQPGELDILDGSPPCSAFSVAGKREKLWGKEKQYSDVSQSSVENLFFEYVRILNDIQPKVFVAENVAGLSRGVSCGFLNEFFQAFYSAGYIVRAKILNAKYLGVPQNRERLIFVGIRKDLWSPDFEGLTHPKPFDYIVTLQEAFCDIKNSKKDLDAADISRFAIYKRAIKLKPGEADQKRFSLVKGNPKKVAGCLTATSAINGSAGIFHWDNRAFTIPEMKRITSIPDDYILTGTIKQQAERLGRMVPPLMMRAVAENIYKNILSKL